MHHLMQGVGNHMGRLCNCHHAAFAAIIRRFTVHRVQDMQVVLCEFNIWCAGYYVALVYMYSFDWVELSIRVLSVCGLCLLLCVI